METKLYNKICKYCNSEFQHESRNQRYCSSDCMEKAQIKRVKQNKTRARKRREYDKAKETNRLLSKAYKMAHAVAEFMKIPKCNCEYCQGVEEGQELHHLNLNPLDNRPENLVWKCKKSHAIIHTLQPDVNMVSVIEEAMESADPYNRIVDIMARFPINCELGKRDDINV